MSELVEVEKKALGCTLCRLAAGRTQVVFGEGDPHAPLMVVGEGPGREEDLQGRPFVGRSGQLLDRLLLEEAGLERRQVYIANVVKCRPPNNRDPLPEEIEACHPYLAAQIRIIDPVIIITLGNFASRTLLRRTDGITKLRGHLYPLPAAMAVTAATAATAGAAGAAETAGTAQTRRAMVVPTFHPAAALRGGGEVVAKMRADIVRARVALEAAAAAGPVQADGAPA